MKKIILCLLFSLFFVPQVAFSNDNFIYSINVSRNNDAQNLQLDIKSDYKTKITNKIPQVLSNIGRKRKSLRPFRFTTMKKAGLMLRLFVGDHKAPPSVWLGRDASSERPQCGLCSQSGQGLCLQTGQQDLSQAKRRGRERSGTLHHFKLSVLT